MFAALVSDRRHQVLENVGEIIQLAPVGAIQHAGKTAHQFLNEAGLKVVRGLGF